MKLSELIDNCRPVIPGGMPAGFPGDPDVVHVTSDSRQVVPGSLFIAINGFKADGHKFIREAVQKGAAAVLSQDAVPDNDKVIRAKNTRQAAAFAAAQFYGHPSKDMTLVGITGTNGKTTTSWILESIFHSCGFATGVIGTINIRYNNRTCDAPVTTPDGIDLQKTLAQMKDAGITHVIMEASSHGLDLHRVDGCRFDTAIFTNLTQDHLDYHRDMETYFNCKKRLFTEFAGPDSPKKGRAVINIDSDYGKSLAGLISYPALTISTRHKADFHAGNIQDTLQGIAADIKCPAGRFSIQSALPGLFNLENILCAAAAAHALGIDLTCIRQGINACKSVPGRLEKAAPDFDRFLFVDYAHTPDALNAILNTLKKRVPKRLITVFGCGGDRDKTKRPLMGQAACRFSDIAIVTSDNPRSENPEAIIQDIIGGLTGCRRLDPETVKTDPFQKGYLVEPDRKKALELAVDLSLFEDTIIAAGKGHETYQITPNGKIHFDDREILAAAAKTFKDRFKPVPWTVVDICTALGCAEDDYKTQSSRVFSGISTDSRTIGKEEVFVALQGDRFDGHTFIQELVDQGIRAFVVHNGYLDFFNADIQKDFEDKGLLFFKTSDTLAALGDLARFQRTRSSARVLAITGSSGKTTTRKIARQVFSTRYHTLATTGNLNNEIGVPLTLLRLSHAHEWAIIEMGMNHPGEMSRLSRIACPDMAMVLNTAGVHLEGLGSVENVARAKAEIFDGIKKGGTAILPAHDPRRGILEQAAAQNPNIRRICFFGAGKGSQVNAHDVQSTPSSIRFTTNLFGKDTGFEIPSPGVFMVDNCLSVILAANLAQVGLPGIKKGLAAFTPVKGRMNITRLPGGIMLIDDTYNANPSSVEKALETLEKLCSGSISIAVLADMLELGKDTKVLHQKIGKKAAQLNISRLFATGPESAGIIEGAIAAGLAKDATFYTEKQNIAPLVLDAAGPGTWVLVKGSRGMAMEQVVENIKQLAFAKN